MRTRLGRWFSLRPSMAQSLDPNLIAHPSRPTPHIFKLSQSVPGTARVEEYRDAVCLDLNESVSVVAADYFRRHFLPELRPEIDVTAVLQQLKGDGTIQSDHWALFSSDPKVMTTSPPERKPLHEDQVFKRFAELAKAIENACLRVSNIPDTRRLCKFKCNPSRAPICQFRDTISRPDSYAILSSAKAVSDPTEKAQWVDVAVPGEFKKSDDSEAKRDVSITLFLPLAAILPVCSLNLSESEEDTVVALPHPAGRCEKEICVRVHD